MAGHEIYIRRCFDLAQNGQSFVAPNPLVGAVIVANGKVIGEGWHKVYGEAHAEINALADISPEDKHLLKSATLYVNLEPCAHHGNTPPCAERIVLEGIPTVVISNTDPNPKVKGKGIEILQKAGIEVITDVLKKEGLELNRHFFTYHTKKRPFITLKWAQSADGFISKSGERTLISGEVALRFTHQLRATHAAILVGTTTALIDNPSLTLRYAEGRQPIRVLIDKHLKVFTSGNLFSSEGNILIFNTLIEEKEANREYIQVDFRENILPQIMQSLFDRNIQSLLVEGGAFTIQQFLDQQLWDESIVYQSPIVLKEGVKSPSIHSLPTIIPTQLGEDILYSFRNPV